MRVLQTTARRNRARVWVSLFALTICAVNAKLSAEDPLRFVPSSSASVVVFRNLEATCKNVNQYLSRSFPESHQLEPRDIEGGFGLPSGTIEFSRPVVIIGTSGGIDPNDLILGFTPKQDSPLRPLVDGPEGLVKTCPGTDPEHFMLSRGGMSFVAANRKALRVLRVGTFRKSLGDSLDSPHKKLLDQSDVFVRFSMDRWRDKINPWIALMSGAISAGMAQNSPNSSTAESAAMLSWFSDGARAVVDQMRTISVGLSFDGRVFRIRHLHTFVAGESTALYLNQIKRNQIDFASLVPDRRFIMMVLCNWETPADNSISYRLLKQALSLESVRRRFDPEQREKLLAASHECYGGTIGSYFLMGTPEGCRGPVQIFGGDVMRNAAKGIKHMKYIQENAADLVSTFLPGTGYGNSKLREKECKGKPFLEMSFVDGDVDKEFLRGIETVYGPEPVFQMAVASRSNLIFTVCGRQSPQGVCQYLTASDKSPKLKTNERVTSFSGKMMPDANVICMFDTGALFDSLPVFMRAALEKQGRGGQNRVEVKSELSAGNGALIGWAGKVQKNAFLGEFIVDGEKIPALVSSAKRVAIELQHSVGGVQPPAPPQPPHPPKD